MSFCVPATAHFSLLSVPRVALCGEQAVSNKKPVHSRQMARLSSSLRCNACPLRFRYHVQRQPLCCYVAAVRQHTGAAHLIWSERRVEDAEAEGVAQGAPCAAEVDGGLRDGGGAQGAPQEDHAAHRNRAALCCALTRPQATDMVRMRPHAERRCAACMDEKRACAVGQRRVGCSGASSRASHHSPQGGECNPMMTRPAGAHWCSSSEAMLLAMAWTDGSEKLTTMPPSAGGPPPV